MLIQSLRMTLRDWRAGELRFVLLALVVAVAALSSVSFFVERMRAGLDRDAHQLLGADLVVRSDHAIDPAWTEQAARLGLSSAQTITFPSMASSGQGDALVTQLASVKAVTPGYPLRGSLRISDGVQRHAATRAIPASGTVWVDANLLIAHGLELGDSLRLGQQTFVIASIIEVEPDRGAAFMNFAPRLMLAASDLDGTGLIQEGSRITWRLLLAGPAAQNTAFRQWLERHIDGQRLKGVSMESLESGRPEMHSTLVRAEQFLSLVGFLTAMLAAVAIAMAARRFMLRHLDACAMLRCLGLTQAQVTWMYLLEFVLVGLVGSALGAALGYGAHFLLLEWLGQLVAADLPAPGWWPALQGVATGMLLLLGFALAPILQLRNVPHNRVIRREQEPPQALTLASYALGFGCFMALLLWQAGSPRLGLLTAGGFLAGLGLFALAGWLGIKVLRALRGGIDHPSWRFAANALQRRPGATVVQVVALSLGLMALLLLSVIRADLVSAWRAATPADAPNRFILNIQEDQMQEVRQRLVADGVAAPVLYPMIRGRLVRINEHEVSGASYVEDRARRLVNREFNLSTMHALPAQNQISQGRWFDDSKPEASVEEGLAKTLGMKLGDRISFDVAGQVLEAQITSLRKLEWGSMQVNFFVILNPAVMADMPQSWITAVRVGDDNVRLASDLVSDFPNLTVVDVGSVVRQIQTMVEQVVTAVEFLFLFTLAAGFLVLYAALLGSQDQRTREAALLRALGATRRQLSQAQWIEFALVGGLAGLLAATGAALVGWVLAQTVFNFDWVFTPGVWLAGLAIGVVCALAGGWLGLRNVLQQPPLQSLREG